MTETWTWETTEEGVVRPVMEGQKVAWAPQPGAQDAFTQCKVQECLLEGNRGGGKTDALIMDFTRHVGEGFGEEWRGILFRKTYKQLSDVVAKTKKWFPRMRGGKAVFNSSDMFWKWPSGEILYLSYMEREDDYYNYHGKEFPWIAWEELTTWADDKCYKVMMSCWRSPHPKIPKKYRATTNPYGVGHNWVKARFNLPVSYDAYISPVIYEGKDPPRCSIHCDLRENKVLTMADPDYIHAIAAAARNPAERAAWVEGSWDIVAGGMFDDLWAPRWQILPNLPFSEIPRRWKLDRSYDHGQSKPFSVGWWAESNGEPLEHDGRTIGAVRGDLIRIAEWYGCVHGQPNEGVRMLSTDIAEGILEREADWGLEGLVKPGPADSSIFADYEPGKSPAGDMKARGVKWIPVDKSKGSRVQGWQQIRKFLAGAIPGEKGIRENPGLFACARCEGYIRTMPVLPRDDKNLDDVHTESEDHIGDEVRYRLRSKTAVKATSWGMGGPKTNKSLGRRKGTSKRWTF